MAKSYFTPIGGESWKAAPGFEGAYEVSDHGRVRSLDRVIIQTNGVEKRLKGSPIMPHKKNSYGYTYVYLGRGNRFLTHRLVMLAFVGDSDLDVDHINGDQSDNRLANLRYLTHAENMVAHRPRTPRCHREHSYENAYWDTRGRRQCRECRREADRRRYKKYGNRRNIRAERARNK